MSALSLVSRGWARHSRPNSQDQGGNEDKVNEFIRFIPMISAIERKLASISKLPHLPQPTKLYCTHLPL